MKWIQFYKTFTTQLGEHFANDVNLPFKIAHIYVLKTHNIHHSTSEHFANDVNLPFKIAYKYVLKTH
jgi:hypothetical protein